MGRIDTLGPLGGTEPVDPTAETVINGTPYRPHGARPAGLDSPVDQSPGELSEEIKRRQIALAVRYVTVLSSATR
jgi:hypothetical protein